jgi:hypothetical protein
MNNINNINCNQELINELYQILHNLFTEYWIVLYRKRNLDILLPHKKRNASYVKKAELYIKKN